MKILGIIGSPRKNGTVSEIVEKIADEAEESGHDVNVYSINSLNIHPCQACYYCKDNDGCDLDDDMVNIYNELYDCDLLVIGSPIYFGEVTAQTKLFTDRLYGIYNNKKRGFKDKKAILIYVYGNPDENVYDEYISNQKKFLYEFLGFEVVETIILPGTPEKKYYLNNQELIEKIKEIGSNI